MFSFFRLALQMNVVSVLELISLCRRMSNLAALVHVSTAYANCDQTVVNETVYEPTIHPDKLIQAAG